MKERPILFSGPMVRALLAGTKTQTRRVVKPQFAADAVPAEMGATNEQGHQISGHSGMWWCDAEGNHEKAVRCPYGQPSDRLWVRETWKSSANVRPPISEPYIYAADLGPTGVTKWAATWKPSIHMPRAASRITLEVTSVRVERLQDISRGDAMAEGIQPDVQPGDAAPLWRNYSTGHTTICPIHSYRTLWELINGPGSWDANPWVWVVEFKPVATTR